MRTLFSRTAAEHSARFAENFLDDSSGQACEILAIVIFLHRRQSPEGLDKGNELFSQNRLERSKTRMHPKMPELTPAGEVIFQIRSTTGEKLTPEIAERTGVQLDRTRLRTVAAVIGKTGIAQGIIIRVDCYGNTGFRGNEEGITTIVMDDPIEQAADELMAPSPSFLT